MGIQFQGKKKKKNRHVDCGPLKLNERKKVVTGSAMGAIIISKPQKTGDSTLKLRDLDVHGEVVPATGCRVTVIVILTLVTVTHTPISNPEHDLLPVPPFPQKKAVHITKDHVTLTLS